MPYADPPKEHRFKKGVSGNPKGKPKGALSITKRIREELEKKPEGEDKLTYLDLLVKRVLATAIKKGDIQMLKTIWNYMDGMPREKMDITTGGKKIDFTNEQKTKIAERIIRRKELGTNDITG